MLSFYNKGLKGSPNPTIDKLVLPCITQRNGLWLLAIWLFSPSPPAQLHQTCYILLQYFSNYKFFFQHHSIHLQITSMRRKVLMFPLKYFVPSIAWRWCSVTGRMNLNRLCFHSCLTSNMSERAGRMCYTKDSNIKHIVITNLRLIYCVG